MLTLQQIEQRIVSMADAVRSEIAYEVAMDVDFYDFYLLDLKRQSIERQQLSFNLYKFKF